MKVLKWLLIFFIPVMLSAETSAASNQNAETDKAWQEYVKELQPIEKEVEGYLSNDSPYERQDLYRFIYSQISLGYVARFYSDPEYPDFIPYFSHIWDGYWPNPDDVYRYTRLNDKGVYRIFGYKGTNRLVDFYFSKTKLFTMGLEDSIGTRMGSQSYHLDDLSASKDGAFEVIISPTRPEGYKGNWWKLPEGTDYLLVRAISYDWAKEKDVRLAIERLDRSSVRPKRSIEELKVDLEGVATFAKNLTKNSLMMAEAALKKIPPNTFKITNWSEAGGVREQKYIQGSFDLQPDEALVVTTELPKRCLYWNVQLVDQFWRTIGVLDRQSSINGHQAYVDRDGKFRAVISATDPGVPNWLDNGGNKVGLAYFRWTGCDSSPTPTAEVVKLDSVRKYLPETTPKVTPIERDKRLRDRQNAAKLRIRW